MFYLQSIIGLVNFTVEITTSDCEKIALWNWIITHFLQSVPGILIAILFFHKSKNPPKYEKVKSMIRDEEPDLISEVLSSEIDEETLESVAKKSNFTLSSKISPS